MAKKARRQADEPLPYLMFRLTPEQKAIIEKAAAIEGFQTVAEWVRQVALRAANKSTANA